MSEEINDVDDFSEDSFSSAGLITFEEDEEDEGFTIGGNSPGPEVDKEPAARGTQDRRAAGKEEEDEDAKAEKLSPRTVDKFIRRIDEAKGEASRASAELAEARRQLDQYAAWQEQIDAAMQADRELSQRPQLDPKKDPVGYLDAKMEALRQDQAQREYQAAEQKYRAELDDYQKQMADWAGQDVQRFSAEHPDYQKAIEHLVDYKTRELSHLHGLSQEQAIANIRQWAVNMTVNRAYQGQSPAEFLYQYAIDFTGWNPGHGGPPPSPQNGNGRQPYPSSLASVPSSVSSAPISAGNAQEGWSELYQLDVETQNEIIDLMSDGTDILKAINVVNRRRGLD